MPRRTRKKTEVDGFTIDLSHITEQLRPLAVEVGLLTCDPENVRLHDEQNIDSIAASLKRYGQRKPIVVQKDGMKIRAGNGTVVAAKRLGWTHVAAVVVDENDQMAAGYGVADNRTAEFATWDTQGLIDLIGKYELDPTEYALGFGKDELGEMQLANDAAFEGLGRLDPDKELGDSPMGDDGKPTGAKCDKNGQWFYVEFYKQPKVFKRLQKKLAAVMRTEHEIEASAFERIIDECTVPEASDVEKA